MEKTYVACGGIEKDLCDKEMEELLTGALSEALKDSGKVIALPPDITRIHSKAGFLTEITSNYLKDRLGAVLPALGTHKPMIDAEISRMFGNTPKNKFLVHNWRNNITELGRIEDSFVEKITEGKVCFDWPVQVNKLLTKDNRNFSLIISIGQVVVHEVCGMSNHAKNIFVGTGGKEAIDKSHFIGAVYGIEKIMGRINTPVRNLFDEGFNRFGNKLPPILWVLTVINKRTENETGKENGTYAVRGLYIGFGRDCFEKAALLSSKVNVNLVDEPVNKMLVYLNPEEYRTTWLGNKAIYRTRMAMADSGELIILAPGLERFGEDLELDQFIRKYGYRSTNEILKITKKDNSNLCAAAHLIHGSSEGRFTIRYCPGEKMSRNEIEDTGFKWGNFNEMKEKFDINKLSSGWNTLPCQERFFYVSNPALGLWTNQQL